MAKLTMSSPWVLFYKDLEAMFGEDPKIRVLFDEEQYEITLYVEDGEKAYVLNELLPKDKVYGNVTLKINVVPANGFVFTPTRMFEKVFEGNPALSYVKNITLFAKPVTYVVFKNKVVQYFSDDLGDIHGFRSTLYQEIAKEIFGEIQGVYFCTDVEQCDCKCGAPLGEWP